MKLTSIVALAVFAGASPAAAVNLVANGSFEAGTFTGWSQVGDTSYTSVMSGPYYAAPTDGTHQARFGPTGGYGGITQAVGVAGTAYRLSFDLGNNAGNGAVVSFGGVTVLTDPVADGGAFHHYSFVVTPQSNLLTFSFFNQPAWYTLDNVVVQGVIGGGSNESGGVGGVPDAPTWALFIAGFGFSGLALRRRRLGEAARV